MAEQTRTQMTAEEFEALPESQKPTELIEGELMVRGVPTIRHQRVVRNIFKLLDDKVSDGEVFFAPVSIKLNQANYYQPDILWVSENNPHCDIGEGGIDGAPDLVVEVISAGTAKIDRGIKFETYQKAGVREYWIVEPEENFLEVWQLEGDLFVKIGLFMDDERFTSPTLNLSILTNDLFLK